MRAWVLVCVCLLVSGCVQTPTDDGVVPNSESEEPASINDSNEASDSDGSQTDNNGPSADDLYLWYSPPDHSEDPPVGYEWGLFESVLVRQEGKFLTAYDILDGSVSWKVQPWSSDPGGPVEFIHDAGRFIFAGSLPPWTGTLVIRADTGAIDQQIDEYIDINLGIHNGWLVSSPFGDEYELFHIESLETSVIPATTGSTRIRSLQNHGPEILIFDGAGGMIFVNSDGSHRWTYLATNSNDPTPQWAYSADGEMIGIGQGTISVHSESTGELLENRDGYNVQWVYQFPDYSVALTHHDHYTDSSYYIGLDPTTGSETFRTPVGSGEAQEVLVHGAQALIRMNAALVLAQGDTAMTIHEIDSLRSAAWLSSEYVLVADPTLKIIGATDGQVLWEPWDHIGWGEHVHDGYLADYEGYSDIRGNLFAVDLFEQLGLR